MSARQLEDQLGLTYRTAKGRFWKRLAEESELSTAGQDDPSAEHRKQLYRVYQRGAEARHWTLQRGEVVNYQPELSAERIRQIFTDHGISPRCAPRRKAIEELTDTEFEVLLERCTRKTDQQAI